MAADHNVGEQTDLTWKPVVVRLGDLEPWQRNPRKMRRKAAERLLQSWREFGQVQTVAVGPNNEVYDGHQRLQALLTVYGPDYQVIALQSNRSLTEEERERLVLILHAGAVGEWSWDVLKEWDPATLAVGGIDQELYESLQRDIMALGGLLEFMDTDITAELEPPEEFQEYDEDVADNVEVVKCPKCGHIFRP